jgi:hypothetical protein
VQVGDLVELSGYAKKRKGLKWLYGDSLGTVIGIVIERVHELSRWRIHWFGKPVCIMHRKYLKHVKAKKTLDNAAGL